MGLFGLEGLGGALDGGEVGEFEVEVLEGAWCDDGCVGLSRRLGDVCDGLSTFLFGAGGDVNLAAGSEQHARKVVAETGSCTGDDEDLALLTGQVRLGKTGAGRVELGECDAHFVERIGSNSFTS